jgi:Dipeptidyl aminopeptidases/acylaminoacyl-peptidases
MCLKGAIRLSLIDVIMYKRILILFLLLSLIIPFGAGCEQTSPAKNMQASAAPDSLICTDAPETKDNFKPRWNSSLFKQNSYHFDPDLALMCAYLSNGMYKYEDLTKDIRDFGFDGQQSYNYYRGDSLGTFVGDSCFIIAHDTLTISGQETTVLCIICRGSHAPGEYFADWVKGRPFDKTQDFYGVDVYTNVYDYYDEVMLGLYDYVDKFPEILSADNLKIVVTGHSLGGSAANLAGADITFSIGWDDWWSDMLTEADVYVYTFGAIKVLTEDQNYPEMFENIHNIYNYYDSFGPHGNMSDLCASSPYAKFGHTDMYKDSRFHYSEGFGISSRNHDLDNYIDALLYERDHKDLFDLKCDPNHHVDPIATQSPSQTPVNDSPSVPDGTYVAYAYGIITNSFTFYGDHRVSMCALGVVSDGTYVISNGEITITYTTNISSSPCVWRTSFSMEGNSIFVGGDEMVKQGGNN